MPLVPRTLVLILLGLLFAAIGPRSAAAVDKPAASGGLLWVYVGTYTKTPEAGINFFQFDLASGSLTKPAVVAKTPNPTFLALHPRRPLLYSISEVSKIGRSKGGFVSAYAIQAKSGQLDLLNQQSSEGPGPCHVSVDHTGQLVLAANYSGGSVAGLPLRPDGGLKPASTVDQHHGSSVQASRQSGPYAHCIVADPANRFALSADLGTDKVMIYRLNAAAGTFTPHDPAFVETARVPAPGIWPFIPTAASFM